MNKVYVLIVLLSAFISVKGQSLVDGERLDSIQIGKSTVYDVIANYGADYKLKKNTDYSNALFYEKLGLIFYSCQSDPRQEIFTIVMQSPFYIQTSKGIVLGKSTLRDVYNLYGKWDKSSAGFEYEKKGLYFDTDSESLNDFESDNMNFAQSKRMVTQTPTLTQNYSIIKADDLINSSNSTIRSATTNNPNNNANQNDNANQNNRSNNNLANQNQSPNNSTNSSKSNKKTTEDEDFESEVDSWGNEIVNKIELIEKGRLRQCHIDFEEKLK